MFGFNFNKNLETGLKRSREGFFSKIAGLFRSKIDDSTWDEIEELLISADVGMDTTQKLLETVKKRIKNEKLTDGGKIQNVLKEEIIGMLSVDHTGQALSAADNRLVILMVGVNGSGKTTSIAKLAKMYKDSGKKVILGAADTFRAAAIEQIKTWGERIGVDVIAHQSGADPGAVAFDTLEAARNRQADIVIIDTAGRLQTKHNLMDELKKIKKIISKFDYRTEVLLVIDATTGQNGLSQARTFTEAAEVSGIILSKLDGTAKGGIVLAICNELHLPIRFVGTGEKMEDIAFFNAQSFTEAIFNEGA